LLYHYTIENGVLHNLYGPAMSRHTDNKEVFMKGSFFKYFINGKIVYDVNSYPKHTTKLKNFENKEIFHFEEITGKKSEKNLTTMKWYRRKEGVDYKKHYLNLKQLREQDIRKIKIKKILI